MHEVGVELNTASASLLGRVSGLGPSVAKRIIENEIKPDFRESDYYAGIDAGTSAIMQALKGEYKAEEKGKVEKLPLAGILFFIFLIIFRR